MLESLAIIFHRNRKTEGQRFFFAPSPDVCNERSFRFVSLVSPFFIPKIIQRRNWSTVDINLAAIKQQMKTQ